MISASMMVLCSYLVSSDSVKAPLQLFRYDHGTNTLLFHGDTLWMSTNAGLRWVDTTSGQQGWLGIAEGLPAWRTFGIGFTPNGELEVGVLSYEQHRSVAWVARREPSGLFSLDTGAGCQHFEFPIGFGITSNGTRWLTSDDHLWKKGRLDSLWTGSWISGMTPFTGRMFRLQDDGESVWYDDASCLVRQDSAIQKRCFSYAGISDYIWDVAARQGMAFIVGISGTLRRLDSTGQFDSIAVFRSGSRLQLDGQEGVWIGSETGGLKHWTPQGGLQDLSAGVTGYGPMALDSLGRVWIFEVSTGAIQVRPSVGGDVLRRIPFPDTLPLNPDRLAWDANGVVWNGDAYFDGKHWNRRPELGGNPYYLKDGRRLSNFYLPVRRLILFDGSSIQDLPCWELDGVRTTMNLPLATGRACGGYLYESLVWSGSGFSKLTDTIPSFYPSSMARHPDGFWMARQFSDARKVPRLSDSDSLSVFSWLTDSVSVDDLVYDQWGMAWYISQGNLYRWDGVTRRSTNIPSGRQAKHLAIDPSGRVWVDFVPWARPNGSSWIFGGADGGGSPWGVPLVENFPALDPHGDAWFTSMQGLIRVVGPSRSFYDTLNLPPNYPWTTSGVARRGNLNRQVIQLRWMSPNQIRLTIANGATILRMDGSRIDSRSTISGAGMFIVKEMRVE